MCSFNWCSLFFSLLLLQVYTTCFDLIGHHQVDRLALQGKCYCCRYFFLSWCCAADMPVFDFVDWIFLVPLCDSLYMCSFCSIRSTSLVEPTKSLNQRRALLYHITNLIKNMWYVVHRRWPIGPNHVVYICNSDIKGGSAQYNRILQYSIIWHTTFENNSAYLPFPPLQIKVQDYSLWSVQ
jgi:hypothetical protein